MFQRSSPRSTPIWTPPVTLQRHPAPTDTSTRVQPDGHAFVLFQNSFKRGSNPHPWLCEPECFRSATFMLCDQKPFVPISLNALFFPALYGRLADVVLPRLGPVQHGHSVLPWHSDVNGIFCLCSRVRFFHPTRTDDLEPIFKKLTFSTLSFIPMHMVCTSYW